MTIGIFKGGTPAKSLNIGGASIAEVFAGATKVWPDDQGPLNLVINNGVGLTIEGIYRVGELATQYGYGGVWPGDAGRPPYGTLTGDQKTNVIQQLGPLEADRGESTEDCDFFCVIHPGSPLYDMGVTYRVTCRGNEMITTISEEDIYLMIGSVLYRYTRWIRTTFQFGGPWAFEIGEDIPVLIEYPI